VVPAVVRGTRRAFPPKKAWPHPARIEIEFLEPIVAQSQTPDAVALELRDRARLAILEELREPDLVAERAAAA
jgi:1-acyl-sn-glycerol-3-phosphate acyltransferase